MRFFPGDFFSRWLFSTWFIFLMPFLPRIKRHVTFFRVTFFLMIYFPGNFYFQGKQRKVTFFRVTFFRDSLKQSQFEKWRFLKKSEKFLERDEEIFEVTMTFFDQDNDFSSVTMTFFERGYISFSVTRTFFEHDLDFLGETMIFSKGGGYWTYWWAGVVHRSGLQ